MSDQDQKARNGKILQAVVAVAVGLGSYFLVSYLLS